MRGFLVVLRGLLAGVVGGALLGSVVGLLLAAGESSMMDHEYVLVPVFGIIIGAIFGLVPGVVVGLALLLARETSTLAARAVAFVVAALAVWGDFLALNEGWVGPSGNLMLFAIFGAAGLVAAAVAPWIRRPAASSRLAGGVDRVELPAA